MVTNFMTASGCIMPYAREVYIEVSVYIIVDWRLITCTLRRLITATEAALSSVPRGRVAFNFRWRSYTFSDRGKMLRSLV